VNQGPSLQETTEYAKESMFRGLESAKQRIKGLIVAVRLEEMKAQLYSRF
jgi:hypothetical protein